MPDEMQLTNENIGGMAEVQMQSGHQGSWHMNESEKQMFWDRCGLPCTE